LSASHQSGGVEELKKEGIKGEDKKKLSKKGKKMVKGNEPRRKKKKTLKKKGSQPAKTGMWGQPGIGNTRGFLQWEKSKVHPPRKQEKEQLTTSAIKAKGNVRANYMGGFA